MTRAVTVMSLLCVAGSAAAQSSGDSLRPVDARSWTGEHLQYDAKLWGVVPLGGAELLVAGVDTIRGTEALHIRFIIDGGNALFQLHDEWDSWVALSDFTSRRFVQDQREGGRTRHIVYDIFPDSGFYRQEQEGADTVLPTSPQPLDDAAFFYFVRTVPLEPGRRYAFDRYFKPDRNPVTLEVIRRDTLDVPAGRFNCLVVQPIIKGGGIFKEGADGRLWISDDDRRLVVQIRSRFGFGAITMRLTKVTSTDSADTR